MTKETNIIYIAYDGTIAGSASTTVEQELQSLDLRLDTIEAWESKDKESFYRKIS